MNCGEVRFARAMVASVASFVAMLCTPLVASAQLVFEPPSGLLDCLTSTQPETRLPRYPTDVLGGTNAVVRVNLKFQSRSEAPLADIRFNNGGEAFASSVKQHVATYRLPCLPVGGEFVGTQEFQFVVTSGTGHALESMVRVANGERVLSEECMAGIRNVAPPDPPGGLVSRPRSGNVLVQLKFAGPTEPPRVEVLYDSAEPLLVEAVLSSVSAYRLVCMKPGDGPWVTQQLFQFLLGDKASALKANFTLSEFLRAVQDVKAERVRFDFTTMGCPFRVRFKVYQPYTHNGVSELDQPSADRREFVEWLRNIKLAIPPEAMRSVIGSETTVTVPCAVLDLS